MKPLRNLLVFLFVLCGMISCGGGGGGNPAPPNPPVVVTHTITITLGTGVHTPATSVTVNDGGNVTIPFTLDAGYTNFIVNGVASSLNYALTNVTANMTLNASATAPVVTHTITINVGTGVHTPSSSVVVNHGSNASIPFTLDAGYTNLVVTGGNGTQSGLNYALTNVKTDLTLNVSATAPIVTHTITINYGVSGVHGPASPLSVNDGGNVTIPFTMDAGWTNFTINGAAANLNYALTNVKTDLTLNASATAPVSTHTVTINAGPGIHVPSTTLTINDGYTVQFVFTLDIGYRDPVASGLGSNCYLLSIRNYNCTSDPIYQDGQITLTASVDNRYALQYIRTSDNVLFTTEFNSKPITFEVRAAGSGFTPYLEYNASIFRTLPYAIVKEQLYDDGTHGDKTVGDGIYTTTITLTPPPLTRYHDHTVEWMRVDVFAYDSGGNRVTSIIDMSTNVNIGVIDPSQTVGSSAVAADMYVSTNSVNIVVPTLGDGTYFSKSIAQRVFEIYPDVFDGIAVVYVGNTRAYNGFTGNWPHTDLVKITETGLGIPTQDYTAEYGSGGKLQTVISLDNDIAGMSFIHEFAHRWSFFLNDARLKLADGSGVHVTSPTTLVGQHTVGYYLSEQAGGDFLVTNGPDAGFNLGNKYSDWELYLMGFLSPTAVASERFVLNPTVPQSSGTIIPRASTDLIPVSGPSGSQSLEGIYGVRTPDASVSQHNFKVLFVAVSDRPLTLAETSMVNRNAVYIGSQVEGRDILYACMPGCLASERCRPSGQQPSIWESWTRRSLSRNSAIATSSSLKNPTEAIRLLSVRVEDQVEVRVGSESCGAPRRPGPKADAKDP